MKATYPQIAEYYGITPQEVKSLTKEEIEEAEEYYTSGLASASGVGNNYWEDDYYSSQRSNKTPAYSQPQFQYNQPTYYSNSTYYYNPNASYNYKPVAKKDEWGDEWKASLEKWGTSIQDKENKIQSRIDFEEVKDEMGESGVQLLPGSQYSIFNKGVTRVGVMQNKVSKKQSKMILELLRLLPEEATIKEKELFKFCVAYYAMGDLDYRSPDTYMDTSDVENHLSKLGFPNGANDIPEAILSGKTTYSEVAKLIQTSSSLKDDDKKLEERVNSGISGSITGFGYTLPPNIIAESKRIEKILATKFRVSNKVIREDNYRKGNRMNREFMYGTSFKPFEAKSIQQPVKKKLTIIVDGSGSMDCTSNIKVGGDRAEVCQIASAFAYALKNCGVFDVKKALFHSTQGYIDVVKYTKEDYGVMARGGEGFEDILESVTTQTRNESDYIICLTDMRIGDSSQTGLADVMKGKKHMILSFAEGGTVAGITVKKVTSIQDMLNAVITLAS